MSISRAKELIMNVQYFMSEGTARRATVSSSTEGKVSRHVILQNRTRCTMWPSTQALLRRFLTPKCLVVSCYMYSLQAWMQFHLRPSEKCGLPCAAFHDTQKFHSATCRYPVPNAADSDSWCVNYGQKFIYARQENMSLTKPISTKLTLALCFVKNSYTKFHVNPTNGLLVEI
jgi:hypothetical protein